jgi:hypothetical protein
MTEVGFSLCEKEKEEKVTLCAKELFFAAFWPRERG